MAEQEVPWAEIAKQYGFEILAVEVLSDPVHLFVSAPPSECSSAFAPAEIVRLFKGMRHTCRPYRKLKKEFSDAKHPYCLRRQYLGELGMYAAATLWAEGYHGGTAGHVSAETIQPYSEESQKKSFQALKF